MRILGFQTIDWEDYTKKRRKLAGLSFTTFRLPRKDKQIFVGEILQVVVKPRTKGRLYLGEARVLSIEEKHNQEYGDTGISDTEAQKDGLEDSWKLRHYLFHRRGATPPLAYKITLEWITWSRNMIAFVTRDKTLEEIVLERLGDK